MKNVAYKNLCAKKKKKRILIVCTKKVFKPLLITMSVLTIMFVVNILVGNFFSNLTASLQNFVQSFVKLFSAWKI